MSSVTLAGDTSGSILLQAPAVSGSTTINIAAQSGTLNVGGPCFSAWPSSVTSIPDATVTKLTWGTEDWDTNNNFDSNRFTPTVAGYYQINASMRYASDISGLITQNFIAIYKNGSAWTRGATTSGGSSSYMYPAVSGIVYCNGSTDYIEIYAYQNSGYSQNNDNSSYYKFSGCFLRGA
jgi:hypothetical protein